MKDFNIVVARIPNSSDGLLVVPFNENLEFSQRNTFTDSEFLVFLWNLGVHPDAERVNEFETGSVRV